MKKSYDKLLNHGVAANSSEPVNYFWFKQGFYVIN